MKLLKWILRKNLPENWTVKTCSAEVSAGAWGRLKAWNLWVFRVGGDVQAAGQPPQVHRVERQAPPTRKPGRVVIARRAARA